VKYLEHTGNRILLTELLFFIFAFMKIVTIIGARPQFIKAAVISRALREDPSVKEILLHTGQHYDANMSDIFFSQLDIPEPMYNLEVGSGSHAVQTGLMLRGAEEILLKEKPDWTLVYGDTNSTLAGALASVKLKIPVVHVEAGLRSFNRDMPEEINRIVTDRVSDLLFAPTQTAMKNLEKEGLAGSSIFSGDVMYDSVLHFRDRITLDPQAYKIHGIPDKYYLATIHRAENTDNPGNMEKLLAAFSRAEVPVVLPVHPRTRKVISGFLRMLSNVVMIDPVGYMEMLRLTHGALKVLTDSGGLQKEAYFLGVPCITLRNETEWLETVHDNWNIVTGCDPDRIIHAMRQPFPAVRPRNEFGDGHAASVIIEALKQRR
jgi:UDP-GlcNAc3NAcA epimerase